MLELYDTEQKLDQAYILEKQIQEFLYFSMPWELLNKNYDLKQHSFITNFSGSASCW